MAQTFTCPSCGAPLEPEGEKTTILCKYCGESIIVPEDLRDHFHSAYSHASTFQQINMPQVILAADAEDKIQAARKRVDAYQRTQAQVSKNNSRSGIIFAVVLIVGMVILGLVLGGIPLLVGLIGAYNSITGANVDTSVVTQNVDAIIKPDVRIMQPVIFPSKADTLTPDFLAPISDNATDVYQFAYVDGKKNTILWRSADLGKSWTEARAFVDEKQVLIINQTTMTALDRLTGKLLWKTSLDNGLGYCKTCLVQSGSALVVILKDGTVQAVDAANGKLTWHKTLNSTNSDLFLASGQPAVEDKENDKKVFYVFDPATGKIAQRIQPGCPAKKTAAFFDEYEVSPDEKTLLALFDGCIQTLSLPDGKVLTEVLAPQSESHFDSAWPMAWFATKRLVTSDAIFYTDNGSNNPLNKVDITKGNARQLILDKKYSLLPKFVTGNVLVVEAAPSFDSKQREYWGVDTSSGQRLWQYALKGQGELRYYDVHATSTGIFMVQCREDPNSCVWADIDPKTGVGTNSGSGPGGTFFDPAWYKDTFYLGNDGMLMVINTTTGKLLYQWP
jgi:outer membrane protein assembly factor BamB/predicted RNA-binding Zn-ribbon protein involved in translation (DUF1610 family)